MPLAPQKNIHRLPRCALWGIGGDGGVDRRRPVAVSRGGRDCCLRQHRRGGGGGGVLAERGRGGGVAAGGGGVRKCPGEPRSSGSSRDWLRKQRWCFPKQVSARQRKLNPGASRSRGLTPKPEGSARRPRVSIARRTRFSRAPPDSRPSGES